MATAKAEAAIKTVVTDILHKHIGTSDAQGGCYTKAVEHHHEGDETNGGACYQIPVIHEQHQGDADGGGGCYGQPVLHTHGDDCYVSHTHEESCFRSIECTEEYTEVEPFETLEKNCLQHGPTTFDRARAVLRHTVCGGDPENVIITYCQACGPHSTMHTKEEQLCPYGENELERDNPICGKEEGVTTDGHEINCGFEIGQTERFALSCNKTVDGYEIGCGLAQGAVLGKLILTGETDEAGKKAVVSARVEDLSSGKLVLSDTPYTWQDEQGNIIGNGESAEVKDNGNYSVILKLENKDVEKSELRSSILVEGIHKEEVSPSPRPSQEPEASPTPTGNGGGTGGNNKGDGEKEKEKDDGTDEGDGKDENGEGENGEDENGEGGDDEGENIAAVTKEKPDKKEKEAGKLLENELNERDGKESLLDENSQNGRSGKSSFGENGAHATPSASPEAQLKIMKETDSVRTKENETAKEIFPQVKQAETKKGFFASPVVKMITVTAGTMLLFAILLLLFFYLRRSVRIYNDDGEGRMRYLGRAMVRREDDLYLVTISDAMVEKSYTNRYCIKPGLFRWGKEEEQELVVYKETKKAVVCLSKEMIVIL
ncbi:MAG: hypothetical protein NC400_13355 [Clostridium sp.]|nr:hypothetical protein [Clostridium sp.]